MNPELSDFVLELLRNSHEAGAHYIELRYLCIGDTLKVLVKDDGYGMTYEGLRHGLLAPLGSDKYDGNNRGLAGLPRSIDAAAASDGFWAFETKAGTGTTGLICFDLSRAFVKEGNVIDLFLLALSMEDAYELAIYRLRKTINTSREYQIRRSELLERFGTINYVSTLMKIRRVLCLCEGIDS
jgi:hypothetical protein